MYTAEHDDIRRLHLSGFPGQLKGITNKVSYVLHLGTLIVMSQNNRVPRPLKVRYLFGHGPVVFGHMGSFFGRRTCASHFSSPTVLRFHTIFIAIACLTVLPSGLAVP
jgi:hypothetical protein